MPAYANSRLAFMLIVLLKQAIGFIFITVIVASDSLIQRAAVFGCLEYGNFAKRLIKYEEFIAKPLNGNRRFELPHLIAHPAEHIHQMSISVVSENSAAARIQNGVNLAVR